MQAVIYPRKTAYNLDLIRFLLSLVFYSIKNLTSIVVPTSFSLFNDKFRRLAPPNFFCICALLRRKPLNYPHLFLTFIPELLE